MEKELGKCPKHLQNMLMQLKGYNAMVLNHCNKMYLAGTLSRIFMKGLSWKYEDGGDVRDF